MYTNFEWQSNLYTWVTMSLFVLPLPLISRTMNDPWLSNAKTKAAAVLALMINYPSFFLLMKQQQSSPLTLLAPAKFLRENPGKIILWRGRRFGSSNFPEVSHLSLVFRYCKLETSGKAVPGTKLKIIKNEKDINGVFKQHSQEDIEVGEVRNLEEKFRKPHHFSRYKRT